MKILTCRLPQFNEQINKFNKKAAEWSLPLIECNIISQEVEKRKEIIDVDAFGAPIFNEFSVEVTTLEVIGEVPRIAGWSIHSKIQPSAEVKGQNFVFTNMHHASVESLRTCPMFCDHCKTRRLKNTAYFIQHEDGRQMLVGSTCLKDFLPNINIESLLSYMNNFTKASDWDEDEKVPREAYVYSTDHAIEDAYLAIQKFGFVSKGKAEETGASPTSTCINPRSELKEVLYNNADWVDLVIKVEAMKAHMLAKSASGNDFIYNVQIALQSKYIGYKMFGYIAAAVNTWLKDLEAAKDVDGSSNEWLGVVGQRVVFKNLTISGLSLSEGEYGVTLIYRFRDEAGNVLVWFGSKNIGNINDVVNLKATIKAHSEFRGRKQTVLTRCVSF